MLRIASILIISLAFILPNSLQAGIHGILKGKVTLDDGGPAIGATVQVMGTKRGAKVKGDGSYVITNLVANEYEVQFSYVGYDTKTVKVRIKADQTRELNVTLTQGSALADVIEIIGDKLVDKYTTSMETGFDDDEIQKTARSNVNAIVTLNSSVQSTGDGFSIRGSRSNEVQVRVDGMDVGNQFTGGYGAAGTAYYPMVSSYATQQVSVLKGGMSAEYGNSMGGIVNTVVKTGRNDKYEGFLNYRTDLPALYGSQGEGLQVVQNGNNYEIVEGGEGLKYQGQNENNIEFGLGGPIPLLNDALTSATFYLTGRYVNEQNRGAGYEIYDPEGNNLGQLDNNRAWVKNITGRMAFGISDNITITTGGQFGLTNLENQGIGNYYMNDFALFPDGSTNNIPERIAKINVTNNFVNNVFLKVNHSLSSNTFYEFRISQSTNNDVSARRIGNSDPGFFTGFEVLEPVDQVQLVGDEVQPGSDQIVDYYQAPLIDRASADGAINNTFQVINALTGYYEGQITSTFNNPWGVQLAEHGSYGFQFREGTYTQVDGKFTSIVESGLYTHNLQAGFEFRYYEQGRHNNNQPYSNRFYDVYTSSFGGNIYASEDETGEVFRATSQEYNPMSGSVYFQDQLSFKGIIITPGLRFEYFDANAPYRVDKIPFTPRNVDSNLADSDPKFMISPRINVSYPITDRSVIRMNFGIYYQMPQLQYMFDGINTIEQLATTVRIGNPNIEPQRTNQYQVAYSGQFGDYFGLDISAYYNDIYNQLGYSYVQASDPYFLATVGEYGTNKGLEIELRKRLSDFYSFRLAYTLQSIKGTSNSATASAGNLRFDPITRQPVLPLSTFSLGRDITHNATFLFNLEWGNEQGPSIGDIHLLENTYINFTTQFRSGLPYTLTEVNGQGQLSEINSLRGPSRWQIDTRIGKRFMFKDIFGEGFGNSSIELFVDIFNLTNRTAAQSVYPGTQSSIDNGTFQVNQIGNFLNLPHYREADPSNPATINPVQYNTYGERWYNESADVDGNGVVTQEERYQRFVEFQDEVNFASKPLFQIPRRIFFGLVVRF